MYILYVPDFHIADCIELLAKNSRCYATHRKIDHLVMQDDDYKLYKTSMIFTNIIYHSITEEGSL